MPTTLVGLDQSSVVLREASRCVDADSLVRFVSADFHGLPFRSDSVDLIVAAFCVYHSAAPEQVIAEFSRCLHSGGRAILVTKSADSYRALDDLIATAGLDPDARTRPSLYQTFHSGNAASIAGTHLSVARVDHHVHEFHFADAMHVTRYVTTNPKYVLPTWNEQDIAARLRVVLGDRGLSTSSTVSYVVAVRP